MAPLIVDGKVMVGMSGGGYGIRGLVIALDADTGREVWKTHTVPAPGEPGSDTWPGVAWRTGGAPVWMTATYDPALNQTYWGTGNPGPWNLCTSMEGSKVKYTPGRQFVGAKLEVLIRDGAGHIGELQAWNLDTGEQAWSREFESHNVGPVLTTAGGLVFTGGTSDRFFRAFDAMSGEELWRMRTNSGVIGIPTAFAVAGRQYIAVQSGWGARAQQVQDRIDLFRGERTHVPRGGVIWVFALKR